jgi:hypothetical protein
VADGSGAVTDDDDRLAGMLGRARARNSKLLRHRYKEGFDRLNIVLFVMFAAAFLIGLAFVNDPFSQPQPGSSEALLIESEIAAACARDIEEPFITFCHERVWGSHRWDYYSEQLGIGDNGWLYGALLVFLAAALAITA